MLILSELRSLSPYSPSLYEIELENRYDKALRAIFYSTTLAVIPYYSSIYYGRCFLGFLPLSKNL